MMFARQVLSAVALLQAASVAVATDGAVARDYNYYAANGINPNVDNSMYYAESANILNALSKFDKLYVSFENCVWSTYDVDDDTCGADGGDEHWYMGMTECFRANAAYSLYGVLKGNKDTGCNKANFIQSLFTTTGVEAFTTSVAATGKVSFSSGNGNGDDDNQDYPGGVGSTCVENDNGGRRLQEDNVAHGTKYDAGATSHGLSCSNKKKFVLKSFNSSNCDPTSELEVTNLLSNFNTEINKAQCIEIYSSSSNNGDNGNNNNGGGDNGSPLSLLYNSQTCSIRDYPGWCPDPYSKLAAYAAAEESAYAQAYQPEESKAIKVVSILLLLAGCVLIALAVHKRMRASKMRFRIRFARSKKTPAEGEQAAPAAVQQGTKG